MLLPTYKEPRRICFICVFVCVQSHRERPVWSEARLRGHTKDSRDATEASFSEPRKHHPGLQAELTPEPILQLPAPPSLPFSLSLVFSHLSLSLNVPPFSSRTHGFHTEAPVCGQQPNGLPSASYCWWSGFVFVFDGLTFVHKAQEDSDRPGMDTHTLTLSHTYTYTELKSSAPRPQASSPASVRAMMSL